MTPLEYVTTAAAAAAIVAVGNAIYQAFKASTRSDEGPIRVKGGSVLIEGEDEWEAIGSGQDFKLKNQDNPKLNFWSMRLIFDGVPDGPYFGKTLEVVMDAGSGLTTTTCKVNGGIRVTQPGSLAIDPANNHVLRNIALALPSRSCAYGEGCRPGTSALSRRRRARSSRWF